MLNAGLFFKGCMALATVAVVHAVVGVVAHLRVPDRKMFVHWCFFGLYALVLDRMMSVHWFFFGVCALVLAGMALAAIWTRFHPPPSAAPQGTVDAQPGRLPAARGENSPEQASERLRREADEDQRRSMDQLNEFSRGVVPDGREGGSRQDDQ